MKIRPSDLRLLERDGRAFYFQRGLTMIKARREPMGQHLRERLDRVLEGKENLWTAISDIIVWIDDYEKSHPEEFHQRFH